MNPYRSNAAPASCPGPGAWERVRPKLVVASHAIIVALVVAIVVPLRLLMGLDPLGF